MSEVPLYWRGGGGSFINSQTRPLHANEENERALTSRNHPKGRFYPMERGGVDVCEDRPLYRDGPASGEIISHLCGSGRARGGRSRASSFRSFRL